MLRVLALLGLFLTTACATVTQGTTATIAVTTEPAGATCTVSRDGSPIAVVNPTPGTVTISRSSRDLAVRCERQGFQPAVATAPAGFQPMTMGNLLIGGLIGVAVDAASGAISTYPANVALTLPPGQFGTTEAREAWFATRRREIDQATEARIATARAACPERSRGAPTACDMEVSFIEGERAEQLRLLAEQERASPLPRT
ncbi:hypothetical protein [Sabulicella rubraurantiaca]|uniref:hypothetical protein n=1 Tax=Sabulicella rubraurantiaca TaxID=2811429 RepID=UPI001A95FF54|nr:hypothetical protein [Sabulicella rubraurantiaca]